MENDVIYETLMKINERIGSMDTKLDEVKNGLQSHLTKDETVHEDQETRIGKVEDSQKRFKWIAIGAAAVITFGLKFAESLGLWFHH